jgi:hypothetical protein
MKTNYTPVTFSPADCRRIADAQEGNARLFRQYERRSPWNSKTRAGFRDLAETAEKCAREFRTLIA